MKASILFPLLSGIFLPHVASAENGDIQPLPFRADFSSTRDYPEGPLTGNEHWKLEQGTALIRDNGGERVLVIPPSTPHGQVSVYFTTPEEKPPLFIDLTLKMGAGTEALELIDANGSLAGLVRVDDQGKLMVCDWENASTGSWLDTTVRLSLNEDGVMREWSRLTLRQDPAAGTWDLYVDGIMKGADLGLLPGEQQTKGYFSLLGEDKHEVQLQKLLLDGKNPLFTDENRDGLPDDWQKKLGRSGRQDDPDADGLTNLEEFIIGTDPLNPDGDRDGLTDAEELSSGKDPFTPEETPRRGITAFFWKADGSSLLSMPSNLYKARRHGIFRRNAAYELPLSRLEFGGFGKMEEDYMSRTRGWVVPPVTGSYTFWVSGDDIAEFWLSTDDSPFLRKLVAKAGQSTDRLGFDSFGPQKSKDIKLEAGKRYYFEVQHKESYGDEHFAVAWQIPGRHRAVIGGSFLEAWVPDPRDTDDDCLPDDWQKAHGLTPELADSDPQGDPDKDHLSNAEEYRWGSDPRKADGEGRPGLITRELWFGTPGRYLFDAERSGSFPAKPGWVEYLDSFEGPRNVGTDYLARIYGFVTVPETGAYRFHISGDDQAALWLGSGTDKFTRRKIASVPVRSGWRKWDLFPSQTSEPISLQKGQVLYIEALHKQGDGDDYVSVAWTRPGFRKPEIIGSGDLTAWKPQANDLDGNDLPDDWQNERRLHANGKQSNDSTFKQMSAYGDADNDGVSNEAERLAGTNPQDFSSHPDSGLDLRFWEGVPGQNLSALADTSAFPARPSRTKALPDMDYSDQGENYVARARGFLVPPVTGNYIFSLTGSDHCQLWLSTDGSPFRKELIAEVARATAWRNRTLNKDQQSARISLEAGKKYYIETLHKKGSGKDHLSVGWMLPGVWQTIVLQDFLSPYQANAGDADDDGLPDQWENQYKLDSGEPSGSQGAWGDPDGDLLTNFAEFRNNTDPLLADSGKLRGLALWEVWDSITGITVDRLTGHPRFPTKPDNRVFLKNSTVPSDRGSWYGGRLRGYLSPTVSGRYQLMVSGDDQAALYVSKGESKFDRKFVAGTPFWTDERKFDRDPGQTATLELEAGKLYFFELLHKEHIGRDHAAVAWLAPEAKKPAILSGANLASFIIDTADLDDDELPDDWERLHQLDPNDNGNTDPEQGPWGDPDADGVVNLDEWKLGINPRLPNSDGDAIEDGLERDITGTNPAVPNNLVLSPVSTVKGEEARVIRGEAQPLGGSLQGISQSGTLLFPFELKTTGTVFFKLSAWILPRPSPVPLALVVKLDGMDLGSIPLVQNSAVIGRAFDRLPRLAAGAHQLELSWMLPSRDTDILFEEITFYQTISALPSDEGANTVVTTAADSITSPFCLEGRATFSPLVSIPLGGAVKPLPDSGWYGDIPLPADGSPLDVTVHFENGLHEEKVKLVWKTTNIFSCGNLVIRAGDSLRLTGHSGDEPIPDSQTTFRVNGTETASLHSEQAQEHRFGNAGDYEVSADCRAPGSATPETRTILVKVLPREELSPVQLFAGTPRKVTLSGLLEEVELTPDSSLYLVETPESEPREFLTMRQRPGDSLVALRLPAQGPVLGTMVVSALSILSDMDTWYGTTRVGKDTLLVEMDVFLPRLTGNMRLKVEILAPGVTFEDGTTVRWFKAGEFDRDGMARVRFLMLEGLNTSFCHRMTLYDGEEIIASW